MNNKKLNKQQKEAVALLSIGTFLEYFDLMLYIHMAVLLNELFFPQTNPLTAQLITALTFSSTYLMRPVGGIVIGWIGDQLGRKSTIMLTMSLMACSCIIMANLPTYAEIGITASIVMVLCRMAQGFSSSCESIGAQIYLTEMFKPPQRYIYNQIIDISIRVGGLFALSVASFAISISLNWRFAFWFGAIIAVIGLIARTRLRETPEFANYKSRMKNKFKKIKILKKNFLKYEEKIDKKAVLAYFLLSFVFPVGLYTSFIYCGSFMKSHLGFTAEQVINQNLKVTFLLVLASVLIAYLVKKYHPLKIAQVTLIFFIIFLPFAPYCFNNISNSFSMLLLQLVFLYFVLNPDGSLSTALFKHFPVSKRFRIIAITFGISCPLSTITVSLSLIPLTNYFGYYGIWVIFLPVVIGYFWAIQYLRKLEIKKGSYLKYPNENPPKEDTALKEEDFNYDDLEDEYEPFKNKCKYSVQLLDTLNALSKEENNKVNIKLVEKSIIFAKKWHDKQMRKTGDHPYYWHPLSVANMVAEKYLKTDVIVASILHDVVEDSECTVELIEEKFNKRIAQIVDRLTRNRFINGKHIKLSLEKTLNNLQKLNDNEALFIKQMDRLHNLQTIEGLSLKKQKKMAKETNNSFIKLVAIIGDKLNIYGKVHLENKMFKYCNDILKRQKR